MASLASILLIAGASAISRGEEPEEARARAVRLTSEGAAAYKAEDYAKAIDRFGAAYRAFPAPPLLLNLSRAELKLSRCAEALHFAELFKAAAPDAQATSPDSSDAWLRTVQRSCIEVAVHSSPEGATIFIDGERQTAPDKTPWIGRLPVGTHKVLLWRDGYQQTRASLVVSADAPSSLALTLTPATSATAPPASEQVVPPPAISPVPPPTPPAQVVPPAAISLAPPPAPAAQERVAPAKAAFNPVLRKVGYAGIAVGGAALIAAIVLGVTVQNDSVAAGKLSGQRTVAQADTQYNSISGRATGADALFGVSGVLAAGGIAFAVVF
jgi:hypothetical protein